MTTSSDTRLARRKTRPHWQVQMWFLVALAATLFCAYTVVGAFTWIEDVNWVTTAFAAMGLIGFGGIAFRLYQELKDAPRHETPLMLGLASAFWAVFGGSTAVAVYEQAFVVDDGASWPLLALLAVFVVLMLWSAYDLGRRAWMLHEKR